MTPHVNFLQKSQKNGEDGMGKAGKRHEMVKGTYERLACERVACKSVCVYLCMYVCMCALCGHTQNMPYKTRSAAPATQNARRCRQVPPLPHKVERRHREPSAPPEPAQCHKCHACHAECVSMSPSATPAKGRNSSQRRRMRMSSKS